MEVAAGVQLHGREQRHPREGFFNCTVHACHRPYSNKCMHRYISVYCKRLRYTNTPEFLLVKTVEIQELKKRRSCNSFISLIQMLSKTKEPTT